MKTKILFFLFIMAIGYSMTFAQTTRVDMPLMVPVEGGTFMMGNKWAVMMRSRLIRSQSTVFTSANMKSPFVTLKDSLMPPVIRPMLNNRIL